MTVVSTPPRPQPPVVAAIDMGYGHLRAALSLADALGVPMLRADRPPLAPPREERLWTRTREAYEAASRVSQLPLVGAPLRWFLDEVTSIPHLHPWRDLSAPTFGTRALDRLVERGIGAGLLEELVRASRPLLTTFYALAIAADRAGLDVHCVVTDTDVNRVWAPRDAGRSRIRYLVPTVRAAKRLRQYGVPAERIAFTGFPLPDELVGGPGLAVLQRNLAARLVRLDPHGTFRREHAEELAHFLGALPEVEERRPPLLTFAVGGAGAQAGLARTFLPSMRREIEDGRLRVALVAGVKPAVKERFEEAISAAGLERAVGTRVELLLEEDIERYLRAMNALLARTDVLWTKPSEMTFYAALGLPLVCASPVGAHERLNRRWVRESGAGFKQRDARFAAEWLGDLLGEGALAAAAWAGFTRLPKFGLYRILEAIRPDGEDRPARVLGGARG